MDGSIFAVECPSSGCWQGTGFLHSITIQSWNSLVNILFIRVHKFLEFTQLETERHNWNNNFAIKTFYNTKFSNHSFWKVKTVCQSSLNLVLALFFILFHSSILFLCQVRCIIRNIVRDWAQEVFVRLTIIMAWNILLKDLQISCLLVSMCK